MKIKKSDFDIYGHAYGMLDIAFIVLDKDLNLQYINLQAKKILNLPSDFSIINRNFNELCKQEKIPLFFDDKKEFILKGYFATNKYVMNWFLEIINVENSDYYFILGKNVTNFNFGRGFPILNSKETNNIEALKSHLKGISSRESENSSQSYLQDKELLAQQYLNDMYSYLENVIAQTPCYVYWKDRNFRYLGCNQLTLKIMGMMNPLDVIGKTDYDFGWDKRLVDSYREIDEKIVATGKSRLNFEEKVISKDGQTFYLLVNKMPLFNKDKEVIGIVGISVDITAQKALELELIDAKAKVEKFRATSALGGMIAHELRTPLAALQAMTVGVSEILSKLVEAYELSLNAGLVADPLRKDQLSDLKQLLSDIVQTVRYAQSTISMILTGLHYTTSNEQFFSNSTFSLKESIYKAIDQYPLRYDQKNLISIRNLIDGFIVGDEKILIHVLHNLIKNALQAIQAGDKGKIFIWSEIKEGRMLLFFEDTGTGIPTDHLPRIFEPFYTTKNKTAESVGLGLYFCKVALEKMNGNIECDSTFGSYTRFCISMFLAT